MASLAGFFGAYAEAFERYDAPTIAAYYAIPSLLTRGGETAAIGTPEAALASVDRLLAAHRAWGVETVAAEDVALVETAPDHLVARVDWQLGRTSSRVTWRFATTYVLLPHDGESWQIAAALTHDSPF